MFPKGSICQIAKGFGIDSANFSWRLIRRLSGDEMVLVGGMETVGSVCTPPSVLSGAEGEGKLPSSKMNEAPASNASARLTPASPSSSVRFCGESSA